MRHTVFILLFSLLASISYAQYPITQASKRYFTTDEIELLYEESSREIFDEYKLPSSIFFERYTKLKSTLYQASRKDIVQAFKWVESTGQNTINAKRGTDAFNDNKALYTKYFRKRVKETYYNSKELRKWLSFNKSDRITYYNTLIRVQKDGTLWVKEDIHIYNGNPEEDNSYEAGDISAAGGNNNLIQKGIFRTFPLMYIDEHKLFNNTTFTLLDVRVNGEKERYTSNRHDNGRVIKIGNPNYTLPEGSYTYTIIYKTRYQIKFWNDIDELAWNVTGNSWDFRIDSARCTVVLPDGAYAKNFACYTGVQDSKARDCNCDSTKQNDSTVLVFKTTRPLLPNEGLSFGVSWNKGVVQAPTSFEKYWKLFKENQLIFLYPLLAILMIIYNSIVWRRFGKDPKKGVIIPQFYPHKELSPAAMGYIYQQRFTNKLTAATIVDLAVRHVLSIDVSKEGVLFKSNVYAINHGKSITIPVSYQDYATDGKKLIGKKIKRGEYNSRLATLNRNIESDCTDKYKGNGKKPGFFAMNNKYMAPGNLFTVLAFFYLLFGVVTVYGWQNPFQLIYTGIGLVLCIIVQRFFYSIMPAYTAHGRKVLDEIEGFRMYLKAADEQRINAMNPPEKTIELYERYMPFAIALDCEVEWGEQFKNIIDQASIDTTDATGIYHSSLHSSMRSSDFTSSFASGFSGSISSASTPPSSTSSGSGSSGSFSSGSGSSGGGGGGGGGGGW